MCIIDSHTEIANVCTHDEPRRAGPARYVFKFTGMSCRSVGRTSYAPADVAHTFSTRLSNDFCTARRQRAVAPATAPAPAPIIDKFMSVALWPPAGGGHSGPVCTICWHACVRARGLRRSFSDNRTWKSIPINLNATRCQCRSWAR